MVETLIIFAMLGYILGLLTAMLVLASKRT